MPFIYIFAYISAFYGFTLPFKRDILLTKWIWCFIRFFNARKQYMPALPGYEFYWWRYYFHSTNHLLDYNCSAYCASSYTNQHYKHSKKARLISCQQMESNGSSNLRTSLVWSVASKWNPMALRIFEKDSSDQLSANGIQWLFESSDRTH